MVYFPEVKRRSVVFNHLPCIKHRSKRKSTVIPLLPLWAFITYSRVKCIFKFLIFFSLRQLLRHSVNDLVSRLRNHVLRCFYILCYLGHGLPFVLMLTLQNDANFDDDTLLILTHSLFTQLLNLKLVTRKVLERENCQQLVQTVVITLISFETSICVDEGNRLDPCGSPKLTTG